MEGIKSRVKEYMTVKGFSNRKLAHELGMNSVVVNQYVTESDSKRALSLLFIATILEKDPSLSAEWLIRGNGDMFIVDVQSREYTKKLEMELLVKDGIIKELRSIILEKQEMGKQPL